MTPSQCITDGGDFGIKGYWNTGGRIVNKDDNYIYFTHGTYGSEFSVHSPFNKFTITPPMIVSGNKIIGYLTVNTNIRGGLTPDTVKRLMK